MMSVQVTVATAGLQGFETKVSVGPKDTVGDVADKVSMSQLLGAFSEYSLTLDGVKLDPARPAASYDLAQGVRFTLEADEQSVVGQLEALLAGRARSPERTLTIDELALLYCYKYGLSVNAALKTLGLDLTLQSLVGSHPKVFTVDGKRVGSAKVEEAPPAPAVEPPKPMLFQKPVQKENKSQNQTRTSPKKQAKAAPKKEVSIAIDEPAFLALHTTISGRSFHSKAMQELRAVERVLQEQTFLDVREVVRGGSVGRGTACLGCEDAELVFLVSGLPAAQHEAWLPRLYKAVAAALDGGSGDYPRPVVAEETRVQLGANLSLRIAPSFGSYSGAVQALGTEPPEARPFFDASFTKERTTFIAKQPGSVKAVMRMLKWWREQQTFSSALTTPTDELLELVAVYVSQQCGKVGLGQQVSNSLGLLANLDKVRIVWSQFYAMGDIWAPLMAQRPLLMDPVNPFRNVVDPKDFDPRELMELARTTSFW